MGSYCRRRYVSKLFQNFGKLLPKTRGKDHDGGLICNSHRLLLYNDIIATSHPGGFHLLPFGVRALEKLTKLVDREMQNIGGQKVALTTLAPEALWQKSERWSAAGDDLFTLKDRHNNQFCLGPTHEELITNLVASYTNLSHRQLPIRLYQITKKFRDEQQPKYGLLRGREFDMKDMYSFDTCEDSALDTYDAVCGAYDRIFDEIGVEYVKVSGDTGIIGGDRSHEYHYLASIGQDYILLCDRCGVKMNKELAAGDGSLPQACQLPANQCELVETKAIEVGHTFYLGGKYSSVFHANYQDAVKDKRTLCQMGCYGLGLTRILQAAVECLSTETQIRWPACFAPYQMVIIPKKDGERGDDFLAAAELVSDNLSRLPNLQGEIVIDDRMQLTIGRRNYDADRIGYPYIVILGKQALESSPSFEVIDTARNQTTFMTPDQLHDFSSQIRTILL